MNDSSSHGDVTHSTENAIGRVIRPSFPREQIADVIHRLLNTYLRLHDSEVERFIDVVYRLGIEPFKKDVYADPLLSKPLTLAKDPMFELTPRLLRSGQVQFNEVLLFDTKDEINCSLGVPPDKKDWMMRIDSWLEKRELLLNRNFPVGILIPSDTDLSATLGNQIKLLQTNDIAFIAIDFPSYTDGRGYSLAQLIKNIYGWNGELRAVGDVMIDTVFYMARCGFDSFLIKEGHDPQLALQALGTFTEHYQKSYKLPSTADI